MVIFSKHRLMMGHCCNANGEPDLGKMREFIADHDLGEKLDAIGWATFFIWIGIAWMAHFGTGIGLLGVATIMLGVQVARNFLRLAVEGFWTLVGLAFAIGGIWELLDIQTPLGAIILIALGVAILLWHFLAPGRGKNLY